MWGHLTAHNHTLHLVCVCVKPGKQQFACCTATTGVALINAGLQTAWEGGQDWWNQQQILSASTTVSHNKFMRGAS